MTRHNVLSFQTPPTLPAERECRSLSIPASQQWLGAVNNALLLLTDPLMWQQVNDTDMTPEQVAAAAYEMLVGYLGSGQIGDCSVTPTVSVYQRSLASGASAGATVAQAYIERVFDATPVIALAPVTLDADGKTFHLGVGWWHIEAFLKNNAAGWSFGDISPAGGTPPLGQGVLSADTYGVDRVEAYAWVPAPLAPVRVRQWFQMATGNGQGYGFFATGLNVVATVTFTRYGAYPS